MTQTYTSAAEVADLPPEQAHMLGQILLEEGGFARLSAKDQALVCAIAHRVHNTQDANEAFELQTTFGQRLADRVAEIGGSWGFVISFGIFLFIWAMLNLVILHGQARFDPYPFIFLNLILSMLAAIQAPIIMMAQNRQAEKDRLTTRMDYEVNVKSEHEIAELRQHLAQLHEARPPSGEDDVEATFMRIVSGRWKGKALVAPAGDATRPTSDRARQAVFNILEHAPWSPGVNGAKVLDLFAGTGALGLEALSRGAVHCLFVDTDPAARAALASNIEACSAQGISRVWKRDATDLGAMPATANGPFDLVFLDPPYAKGFDLAALKGLAQGWLHADSLVVLERGRGEPALAPPGFEVLDSRSYGAAEVSFLTLSKISA